MTALHFITAPVDWQLAETNESLLLVETEDIEEFGLQTLTLRSLHRLSVLFDSHYLESRSKERKNLNFEEDPRENRGKILSVHS